VLYNCEATFDTPRTNRQSFKGVGERLLNLATELSLPHGRSFIEGTRNGRTEPWTSLLQSFVRIDLNSSSPEEVPSMKDLSIVVMTTLLPG